MRLIYVDEAGTSASEPMRVVTSVIVEADEQYQAVRSALLETFDRFVPQHRRAGYIFHAKDVFNARASSMPDWHFDNRFAFLQAVLALPLQFHCPIALGTAPAGHLGDIGNPADHGLIEHLIAYGGCLERSDFFLRAYLRGREKAVVIAEDVPERRRFLHAEFARLRDVPEPWVAEHLANAQQVIGASPDGAGFETRHIIDTANFVSKNGAVLLQLADACAFAFRRYLSGQPRGEEMIHAMLGFDAGIFLNDPLWKILWGRQVYMALGLTGRSAPPPSIRIDDQDHQCGGDTLRRTGSFLRLSAQDVPLSRAIDTPTAYARLC